MIEKNMDESNQGFMKHLGALDLKKIDDTNYEFKVVVKEIHLNTGKIAHYFYKVVRQLVDTFERHCPHTETHQNARFRKNKV